MTSRSALFRHDVPHAPPHARIGLFGGSFDPAHDGHLHVSRAALTRLRLDALWWLVSPGNPLKAHGPAPLDARMARARALTRGDPRLRVTAIEATLGTRYTAHTLRHLRGLYPTQRLVWVMGADNLAQMHRWEDWRTILALLPMAVIARPGAQRAALSSKVARMARAHRLPARAAPLLADRRAPAWVFLTPPMRDISSSALRRAGPEPT